MSDGRPRFVRAEVREGAPSLLMCYLAYTIRRGLMQTQKIGIREFRERLSTEEDWPVLARALALECPIRTEDANFFGAGVATWTTDRVELLLSEAEPDPGEPNDE
jgi:hypothetical protein